MAENRIDITSTALEKGIGVAKDFLDKLLAPAVQETGLLIKDQISKFRFNNQLKMLLSAREKCLKASIDPKTISFKILCPLLEGASLEEDEEMTEVWSSLLSNLVDSEQNIENHIFPYLLGQISKQEWFALKESYMAFKEIQEELKQLPDLKSRYEMLESKVKEELQDSLLEEKSVLRTKIKSLEKVQYKEPELRYDLISEDYQFSNLYRLGIVKKRPYYYTYLEPPKGGFSSEFETRMGYYREEGYDIHNLRLNLEDASIHIEEDGEEYYLSELGMVFIRSCLEKHDQ